MKKLNQKNMLSATVSSLMTLVVCSSVSVQASDIEIYSTGFTPNPVVMFALDNSGSMSVSENRRAFDMKDAMQAVLLGEGSGTTRIEPARNVRAGLSTFESPAWYDIKNGNTVLYKTAIHPNAPNPPRRDAGYIAMGVQLLDDGVIYPSTRKDLFPSNGDVITLDGNLNSTTSPAKTGNEFTIDNNNKKAYLRFQVDIPKGATINAAYLEIRSNGDYGNNKLKVRVAKHNDLYTANPTVTRLQSFSGTATSRSVQPEVNNTYLTKIFQNATTQRAIDAHRNSYTGDNIADPIYVYAMNVQSEMRELIQNNNRWCGMGDIIFELSREDSKNYKFYTAREDRVNPHLYIEWTLTDNATRTDNCMFADTKRSSDQQVTNLGNVGGAGALKARQYMNQYVQRIITDTGTPSAQLYAETAAYMLGNSTKPLTNSSPANTSIDAAPTGLTTGTGSNIKYISPIEKVRNYVANPTNVTYENAYAKEQQCGQHGIYFLTDGEAEFSTRGANNTNDKLFASAMGWNSISCNSFNTCSQTMARGLLKASGYTANNRNLKVKTSTVGFYYTGTALSDWAAAGGGQYTAVNASSSGGAKAGVVSSINTFLDDVFDTNLPEQVTTGSPTLPQDALNPLRIQPFGYYASFEPKPQDGTQLWLGNLNKYHVINGQLYANNKTTRLIDSTTGAINTSATGIWGTGGMRGQLPLGLSTNTENEQVANRKIFTNRKIEGTTTFTAEADNKLNKVNVTTLFGTGTTALFANDPQKNYWLNLLGYNVSVSETGITLATLPNKPELRQVGATMHSTPLLLTQSGKITVDANGNLDTTDRDDYLLFGSTQGLLHVVHAGKSASDTNRGKEVFAFAPHEMMGDAINSGQREAFLSGGGSSAGGSDNLFYGIDAPWTAYSQYISKSDKTLTVNDSGRTIKETDDGDDIALKGLQWVYGGLRMGGRSYYALDLSNINDPKLKFHINPANSTIYKASGSETASALSYMGQSWSKPTIAYVKFGGVKKLVMFVGGGYDAGYENAAYNQSTTTQGGAGVYMFDANSGDLLWWTSANATAAMGAEAYTNTSATDINMKYSVVSQINAIDRDNDGLIDHLYFGDLGGQGFRVDINNVATGDNAAAKKGNFITRVVRLFNENTTGGASPRFYEIPSFSIHEGGKDYDGNSGYVAAVAFSSGNRSSPLSGATGTNQAGSSTSANDGVFVVYDKDVARNDLYTNLPATGTTALKTKNISLVSLNSNFATGVVVRGNSGWKYSYSNTAGRYKGMNELYALDGMLYVNVYDRDGTGIESTTCGGGVKGDSYVYQFCLPTGRCSFYPTGQTEPNRALLGGGILGTALGQGDGTGDLQRLTVNRNATLNCNNAANKNKPECQQFSTTAKIRQLRWYETR